MVDWSKWFLKTADSLFTFYEVAHLFSFFLEMSESAEELFVFKKKKNSHGLVKWLMDILLYVQAV